MTDQSSNSDKRERQLDAIIAEYYRQDEAGQAPDQKEFMARYPEFQQELSEFFVDLGMFQHSGRSGSEDPALEPTITAGTSQRRNLATGAVVRYFGVYEILEELGSGGMGVVYKARHARLRKLVALKMIRAGELASEFEVKMFQAEARAAAKLDHPGIVAVHEVGMHAGQHFYSMDYVAGGSLSKLHRDEPVAARRAADLVRQMAEAIHYAHGKGIVHRDLKPANVLLTTTGVPRITDFGLAKRLWADEDSVSVHITETGQILGTAGYMSPEQAEGKTRLVGEPADIYSLGAVLYALLTSRAPFVGESQADTIKQVIEKEPVSPRVLNSSLPRDLETICLKCLNKERHERYGTAQLLAEDLQRFLGGRPVLARAISRPARAWRWCRRNSAVAALLGLVSLVAIGSPIVAWQQYSLKKTTEVQKEQIEEDAVRLAGSLEAEKLASEEARQSAQSERRRRYASDMNLVATHWNSGNVSAVRTLLGQYEPQAGKEDLREFVWHMWTHRLRVSADVKRFPTTISMPLTTAVSPDGQRIAFVRSSRDKVAYPVGTIRVRAYGAPADMPDEFQLPLADKNGRVIGLTFVQNSNMLAVHERDRITLWNLSRPEPNSGDLPLRPPENRVGNGYEYVGEGAFSPNGKLLALPRSWNGLNAPNPGIEAAEKIEATPCEIWDLKEQKIVGKLALPPMIRCVCVSDDGTYLADDKGTVWNILSKEAAFSLPGSPDIARAALFRNGKGIVTQSSHGRLSLWDSEGHESILAEVSGTFAVSVPRQEVSWSSAKGVSVLQLDSSGSEKILSQPPPLGLIYGPAGGELLAIEENGINLWQLALRNPHEQRLVLPKFKASFPDPAGNPRETGEPLTASSPHGTYVMTGRTLWKTSTMRELYSFTYEELISGGRARPARILGVTLTENAEVVTCGMDGVVTIWNGLNGKLVASSFQGESSKTGDESLICVAANLDGSLLAATTRTGYVVLWNRKQESFHFLDAKTVTSRPPSFSPDGQILNTFDVPPGLHIYDRSASPVGMTTWSLATMQVMSKVGRWNKTFRFGDELVHQQLLADGDTQLISESNGEPVVRLGFPVSVSSLAATSDGRNIATLTTTGQLTIWDASTASPLLTADAQPGTVHFLESGKVLALIQNDGNIRRWLTGELDRDESH